ncbi:MAG: endonuclease MutS2 [Alicyclobacillus sp.]|nr:endonuclease MutS2 [Alicyclobacillus sp.]
MDPRVVATLELDKVKVQIRDFAACSLGKRRIDEMLPFARLADAVAELDVVDEALRFLYRLGPLPFGGVTDISSALRKAEIGGVLNPEELNQVVFLIQGGRRVRQALFEDVDDFDIPRLRTVASALFDARKTEEEIRRALSEDGVIHDHASPALAQIRSAKRQLEARMRQQLEQMLRTHARFLQDPVIAMRGDSLCLPVRVEFKNAVPGIVHDVSASGATVYIQPQSVVETGARVRALAVDEEREVERILQALSGHVAAVAAELRTNLEYLGAIDAWFAKAGYARAVDGQRPVLREDGVWVLRRARHPLLPRATAVPVDLELGAVHRMLIITGPNTGGKTVTLKTVGLLTLLAMCGCFLPSEQPCDIGWCDQIFADIGDEQSIEQSLSTFSSHLRNIVSMLERVTGDSLVLLDELGAGTDPAEGAALSMAILDHLKAWGARVVATTHYAELKAYALNDPAATNASMEFDVDTLRPTYRLRIGIPGRSNALAIAARLGLSETVIERARTYVRSDDARVDDLIRNMEAARQEAERLREEARQAEAEASRIRRELETRERDLDAEVSHVRERAVEEARAIVERAAAEAERVITELRARRDSGGWKDHELVELRKSLEAALPPSVKRAARKARARAEVQPGAVVRVLSLGQKGEVVETADEGQTLTVQLGLLRMKVRADEVELLQNATPPASHGGGRSFKPALSRTLPLQLDIRGETVEESLPRIDKYLDDALVQGLERVTIVHGKGTGALRDGVRRYLEKHPRVKSWARGGPGEGGDGATVVTLQ